MLKQPDPQHGPPVEVGHAGRTLVVTINRPHQSNTLTSEVVAALHEALLQARDPEVRCVLLAGAGDRTFSAGADLSALDDGGRSIREMDLFGLFDRIEQLDVPVVAAVNGYALGGGFELTLCADLVVASERAVFGLPETSLGIAPGIAMVRLHHHIGIHAAKELAMTGRRLSAVEAHKWGLVNSVVPADELEHEARSLCDLLVQRSAKGLRTVKRAFNRYLASDWTYVRESMGGVLLATDVVEGIAAFREKRPPEFEGS